ncbi:MAG: dihydropteroate synthase [candidate division NC10 bacterium]
MTLRANLGGVTVGEGCPVALIGVLNVSPESFYPGSIYRAPDDLLRAAEAMVEAGARILDVGAMSTAPYLPTRISEAEEANRLAAAVHLLATKLGAPISADTTRSGPARAALEAGATIINDVSGLTVDPAMASLVAKRSAGLIVMASERGGAEIASPVNLVLGLLDESLRIAREAGVTAERTVVDPGIGFFRRQRLPWSEWDIAVLANLRPLHALGRPLCVGVSRKSFLGAILGQDDPRDRLPGSLAATALAVVNGAHLIRTHDVAETCQAVRVAEAIKGRER